MKLKTANNLEGWVKKFDNKFGLNGLYAKPAEYMADEDVMDDVKQFISDLRKHDMEELIKELDEKQMLYYDVEEGIKNYYNK